MSSGAKPNLTQLHTMPLHVSGDSQAMDAKLLGWVFDGYLALILLDQLRDFCHAKAALALSRNDSGVQLVAAMMPRSSANADEPPLPPVLNRGAQAPPFPKLHHCGLTQPPLGKAVWTTQASAVAALTERP